MKQRSRVFPELFREQCTKHAFNTHSLFAKSALHGDKHGVVQNHISVHVQTLPENPGPVK